MVSRARLVPYLLVFAVIFAAPPTHAQQQRQPIKYTIQASDTLWVIATLYYNAPTAGGALYSLNQPVLDAANKTHPKGPKWIFPGTDIDLPPQIRSRGILYTRRDGPMDRNLALLVGRPDGIDVAELSEIMLNKYPQYKNQTKAPPPFNRHARLAQGPTAMRETAPAWFSAPNSRLEVCARAVCTRFEQLCFFECLAVAKRFLDGEHPTLCERIQMNPHNMSIQLPYEVDEETRDSCAELVQ